MAGETQVGYTGKMPAYGDFIDGGGATAARRAALDWALAALPVVRGAPGFEAAYLSMPPWRFRVPGGAFGPDPALGVVCPSADRAGRLCPLIVVAAPVGAGADGGDLDGWFAAVETALIAALDPDATRHTLGDALSPPPSAPSAPCDPDAWPGPALWSTLGPVGGAGRSMTVDAPPDAALFRHLLGLAEAAP